MDFHRYGIDERLAKAAEALSVASAFHEKMLERAVLKNENVCAKISLSEGVEAVCLLPALQWIAAAPAGETRRVLVAVPDAESARAAAKAAADLGAGIGAGVCLARETETTQPETGVPVTSAEGSVPEAAPVPEGESASAVLIGTPAALLAAASGAALKLRDYGFLVVLGADRLAELPSDFIRKFAGSLLPSWERRCILSCGKLSVKAKNLAWDLADNPAEIHIEEEAANALGVPRETWHIASESKFRFLLGLVGREGRERLCVFCNLRSTVEEVSQRLGANGIGSDYLLGALPLPRKLAIFEKTKSGSCPILVLTDQGAEGLPRAAFPLVVNYDIPLEPEYFVKRLELLDRGAEGAKVVSLACERYVYGLTAVEQYIDASLEAKSADESMLAATDKSEGMSFGRARSDGGRREDTRREDTRRDDTRRDDTRRDDTRRDARSRYDGDRDGRTGFDRSPDIRKSIAEATGGSLDIDAIGEKPERSQSEGRKPERRDESGGDRRVSPRGDRPAKRGGQPGARPGARPGSRSGSRSGEGAHRGGAKRGQRGKAPAREERPSRPAGSGNPYDFPMEERMRRYREKYGSRLGAERTAPARGPSNSPSAKPIPSKRSPEPEPKPRNGFFGKLFGRRKKEDD
jgi:ATP-dependent RNA helicase RhlB